MDAFIHLRKRVFRSSIYPLHITWRIISRCIFFCWWLKTSTSRTKQTPRPAKKDLQKYIKDYWFQVDVKILKDFPYTKKNVHRLCHSLCNLLELKLQLLHARHMREPLNLWPVGDLQNLSRVEMLDTGWVKNTQQSWKFKQCQVIFVDTVSFLTQLSWVEYFFPKKVALKIFLKTFCCCIKGSVSIYVHLGKSAHVDACWVHSSQDLLDEHVVLGGPPTVNRLSLPGGGYFPEKKQISPENE